MLESDYLKDPVCFHVTQNPTLSERMLTGEVVSTTNPSSKHLGKQYRILRTGSM